MKILHMQKRTLSIVVAALIIGLTAGTDSETTG